MKKASTAVLGLLIMVALLNSPARAEIAPDKKLHFQAGLVISSLFYGLHTYGPNSDGDGLTKEQYRLLRRKESLTWGLLAAVSAGIAKELLDAFGTGNPRMGRLDVYCLWKPCWIPAFLGPGLPAV